MSIIIDPKGDHISALAEAIAQEFFPDAVEQSCEFYTRTARDITASIILLELLNDSEASLSDICERLTAGLV